MVAEPPLLSPDDQRAMGAKLAELTDALERIAGMHKRVQGQGMLDSCAECNAIVGFPYPCETVRIARAALKPEARK